jgi:hypothetical protein
VYASARFLLGILFDPADRGDVLFRRAGVSPKFTALQPRRLKSSLHAVGSDRHLSFEFVTNTLAL